MRTPTSEEIRIQLAKLLASPQFSRSARMSRFLRFTVEQALAGAGDQVKEYLVGTEVFDRAPDYDPRVDPIVRVEARRLRAKLTAYYKSIGKPDPVYIELPKGAYTPIFRLGGASPLPRAQAQETERTSIAVLPFANFSPQADDDYFSDGLTEELLVLLTRVGRLRVLAWNSVSKFRGREQDLGLIREELHADVILRGSVRRGSVGGSGARVRVTAQLIDTETGAYLWSESFDRQLHDVVSIQEEIAGAIVHTLRLALRPPREALPPARRVNVECYNLCLQARFHARTRTADGLRRSLDSYTRAIEADPESAKAHAGVADSYSLLADYGVIHPREAMPRAEQAAQCALRLDPDSAEAATALAFIRSVFDWKWEEGEMLYRRAIALNPSFSQARHWFAVDFLALFGRFDEAEPQIQRARDLDPLSLVTHEGSPYLMLLKRDYEACLAELRQLLAMDANFYKAHSNIGRALTLTGKYREAIEWFEKARRLSSAPHVIAGLGQALALAGRRDEAQRCLDELHELSRTQYVPSSSFAIVHLGFGELSCALDWLETAFQNRELPLSLIGIHPVYDPLRGEARFQALLDGMGLLTVRSLETYS